jgi:hypothetical protein
MVCSAWLCNVPFPDLLEVVTDYMQPEQQQRVVQVSILHLLHGNKQPNKLTVEAKKRYKVSSIEQLVDQSFSLAPSMNVEFNYLTLLYEFIAKNNYLYQRSLRR